MTGKPAMRWLIVVVQVVIATMLAFMGQQQTRSRLASQDVIVWDYLAPAEVVLHAINYPAAVATGLTTGHRNFFIGLEHSRARFLIYLFYIAALWYLIGVAVDRGYFAKGPKNSRWLWAVLIWGSFLLIVALSVFLRSPYAMALVLAAFLWSASFIIWSAAMLFRRSKQAIEPQSNRG